MCKSIDETGRLVFSLKDEIKLKAENERPKPNSELSSISTRLLQEAIKNIENQLDEIIMDYTDQLSNIKLQIENRLQDNKAESIKIANQNAEQAAQINLEYIHKRLAETKELLSCDFEKIEESMQNQLKIMHNDSINLITTNSANLIKVIESKVSLVKSEVADKLFDVDTLKENLVSQQSENLRQIEAKIKSSIGAATETYSRHNLECEKGIQEAINEVKRIDSKLLSFDTKLSTKVSHHEFSGSIDKLKQTISQESKLSGNYAKDMMENFENHLIESLNAKFKELNTQMNMLVGTLLEDTIKNSGLKLFDKQGIIEGISHSIGKIERKIENVENDIQDQQSSMEKLKISNQLSNEDFLDKLNLIGTGQNEFSYKADEEFYKLKALINSKCSIENMDSIIESQTQLNDFLCYENCLGRWTWNSGNLQNRYQIPWEEQLINTVTENFFWEKDCCSIIIINKGYYEVNVSCVTSASKIRMEVLINNQVMIFKEKNDELETEKNPTQEITIARPGISLNYLGGLSLSEIVHLTTRSKLAVQLFSNATADRCEALLCIKKL